MEIIHKGRDIWAKPLTQLGKGYTKKKKGVNLSQFLITLDTPDDMLRYGLTITRKSEE